MVEAKSEVVLNGRLRFMHIIFTYFPLRVLIVSLEVVLKLGLKNHYLCTKKVV